MAKKPAEPSKRQALVRALLKKFPDAGHRTLAKRLHDEHPLLFTNLEQARSALRYETGNKGDNHRNRASFPRAPRKPGELPPLPESSEEPWEPYILHGRRVLVISDLHLPFHSNKAIEAAVDFGCKAKADAVLINGDLFDFYSISRFDKDPTKPKVLHELECGKRLFAYLRSRLGVPIHYKLGNHDSRWETYLYNNVPVLFDIEAVRNAWHIPSGINQYKVHVVGEERPVMLGKLPVLHGHELKNNSAVNPARTAFLKANHTIMVSHSHQTTGYGHPDMWHAEEYAWSTGCLCNRNPRFARFNKWNWGAAFVEVANDGTFDVTNFRITNAGTVRKS